MIEIFKPGLYNSYNPCSEGSSNTVDISTIMDSASEVKKGGETVAGHALQKHAGRNPDIGERLAVISKNK